MTTETISPEAAEELISRALMASNTSEKNARATARALVAAQTDGQAGHGFSRVASYAAQSASGKVDGHATSVLEQTGSALLKVDARHGFAFPAIEMAIGALVPLAREAGIAAATITNSHHCGQLGAHVEALAGQGMFALMVANTPKAMAPWGGSKPLYGTNPIAFAAPRDNEPPLVVDLSLSKVARGRIMAAQKAGEPIGEGWALDPEGNPTTDPEAALAGTMIPAGDAKGAALALLVEILAATLTGANHSTEASSFFDGEGDPPGVGQMIIAIDPARTAGGGFGARLESLLTSITDQPGARLPGSGRLKKRAEPLSAPSHLLDEIRKLAAKGD